MKTKYYDLEKQVLERLEGKHFRETAESVIGELAEMGLLKETSADGMSELLGKASPQPVQTAGDFEEAIKEFADIYGLECPNNDGNCGTIAEHGCNGTPEDCERTCPIPVQCEFCYTEPRSKFNLINDLKEMIGGLSA